MFNFSGSMLDGDGLAAMQQSRWNAVTARKAAADRAIPPDAGQTYRALRDPMLTQLAGKVAG
jgi:hypothetical protein